MRMINPNLEKIHKLHEYLSSSSDIVIATHMKPDGDAIGSCLGLYHTLRLYGKSGRIVISDSPASNLDFLLHEDIRKDIFIHNLRKGETEEVIKGCDLLICLDFNAFHRTDTLEKPLEESQASKSS